LGAKTSKFTVNYLFIIKRLDYRKANVSSGRRKLGAPKRPVAALIGDGSFLYNPVVQALGASKGNGRPILIIVCNNGQYRAMQLGHSHHYPDGVAQEAEMWHGVTIDGPDYAELGKPFGFPGQKVEHPAELPAAIRTAYARSRGRQDRDPQCRTQPISNERAAPARAARDLRCS
jgi:TPP-dependent trihydroxycyclohexane-1,2-dione (THcHDO) dehydratase